jgi:hypothetical protein
MNSITFLCFYFGQFPEWADLYFETLKKNHTITFIFYTDCNFNNFKSPNIIFKKVSKNQYIDLISKKLEISFNPQNPYKFCDIRPMLGFIHYEDIKTSDFYGYLDQDLLLSDIRSFYTDSLLSKYDVFSTHENVLSDHLALFRNNRFNREMYKKIGGWKEKLQSDECIGIGEYNLTQSYIRHLANYNRLSPLKKIFKYKPRLYFKEQYSTPFTPIPWTDKTINSDQPDTWYYKDGQITNNRDIGKSFMYIHFMNFKSSKYRHDKTLAPWEGKDKICFAKKEDLKQCIIINNIGINKLHE